MSATSAGQLRIFDVNGRLIRLQTLMKGENAVSVANLSGGIYYFEVAGSVFKVIKQ
ncbi:MAG: T9SS type A sorting domain-containing protein [Bacteroidales bacterium]